MPLCSTTARKTIGPASSTRDADPDTTAATTPEIAMTDTHGIAGSSGSVSRGSSRRSSSPPYTGTSTICTMLIAIPSPSTGM